MRSVDKAFQIVYRYALFKLYRKMFEFSAKSTFAGGKVTKVDALADIHAPFFGPVFSYNLQFLNYFIENKALQAFYFISI